MHSHAHGPADYELGAVANGEPPGEWLVLGANPLNLHGKIHAEGPSGDKFRKLVNHLQNPDTGEQLGRAPIDNSLSPAEKIEDRVKRWRRKHPHATPEDEAAYRVKTAADTRTGVLAWDGTFSAQKSVSVLWAAYTWAERHDEAEKIWEAIEAGVRAALEELFEELSFTRHGPAGPKVNDTVTTDYRNAVNLMTAMFRHHLSREREPNLHVHVMILNRLLTETGAWGALYSGALLRSKPQLDATFQRVMEAKLRELLGVSFVRNPDTPWREIEGVDPDVRDHFSSRSRALGEKAEEFAQTYRDTYGREPNAREKWAMRQRANLQTRKAKAKQAPSREEDLQRWEEELKAATVEHFEEVLATVDEIVALDADEPDPTYDETMVIKQAVADLERESAVFNKARLRHAISQRLPDHVAGQGREIRELVDRLTEKAERSPYVISTNAKPLVEVPTKFRNKRTGESRFEAPDSRKFTTPRTVAMEGSLVSRLDIRGARPIPGGTVSALLAETKLSSEQTAVARGVLTSDRSLELVNAAAGTGKSVTVKAISDVAEQVWGSGATGFTVAETAAQVLRREGMAQAFNIERFLAFRKRVEAGTASDTDRIKFAVPQGGVVVVDEASMLETGQLQQLLTELDRVGVGKVVLVGDTAQLDAVGAGGGFAMLVREVERRRQQGEDNQRVHRMTEVHRFAHQWEREASAALREGRVEALARYHAHGRVRGDENHDRVKDLAVKGFVTDWLSGRNSILVVGTEEQAYDLSSRVRAKLVEAGHVAAVGVQLRGFNTAGVGDIVQSRLNDHPADVLNRDRWQVVGTSDTGELHVRKQLESGEYSNEVQVLDPEYVQRQVELGYASTTNAAQGLTVKGEQGGTSHSLIGRQTSAAHAYVGGSRATDENHFYVELEEGETAVGRLASIFENEQHAKAARVEITDDELRQKDLGHLFVEWENVVREVKAVDHRDMLTRELGPDADAVLSDPAVHRLYGLLRQAELTGHEPDEVVRAVMKTRTKKDGGKMPLAGAESPASLLYARVSDQMKVGPLGAPKPTSFQARVPAAVEGVHDEDLEATRQLARVIDERTAEAAAEVEAEVPEWALRAAGPVPVEVEARQDWRERVKLAAAVREAKGYTDQKDAIGRRPSHVEPESVWLWDQAAERLGKPEHERNLEALSEGQLANQVARWEQAQTQLPRYVDHELRQGHLARRELEHKIVEARSAGDDTAELAARLEQHNMRLAKREEIAERRSLKLDRLAPVQQQAEDAQRELDRRGELEQARRGVPLPVDPDEVEETPEQAQERQQREAEDREIAAHAAMFDLLSRHRALEQVPEYGSPDWHALEPGDPRREAAVDRAAAAWWRMGDPIDREVAELQQRLESAAEVVGVPADDPELPDHALGVLEWQDPYMQGEAPQIGTPEWAELAADDPRRDASRVRAAAAWWRLGETPEVLEARTQAAEDRASSIEISQHMQHVRDEQHRRSVEAERVARIAEENRARTASLMPVKDSPGERDVDHWADAELTARYGKLPVEEQPEHWRGVTATDAEIARLFLDSQRVDVQEAEPVAGEVEWPEVAPVPEPHLPAPGLAPEDEPGGLQNPSGVQDLAAGQAEVPALVGDHSISEAEPVVSGAGPSASSPADGAPVPTPEPYPVLTPAPLTTNPELGLESDSEPEPSPKRSASHLEVPTAPGPEPGTESYPKLVEPTEPVSEPRGPGADQDGQDREPHPGEGGEQKSHESEPTKSSPSQTTGTEPKTVADIEPTTDIETEEVEATESVEPAEAEAVAIEPKSAAAPKPKPKTTDVTPEVEAAPEPAPKPKPKPEPEVDEEERRFQDGLAYTLEQARQQRETEEREAAEREAQAERGAEQEREQQASKAEVDEDTQLDRDLEKAREAVPELDEPEPEPAWEPEPVPAPEPQAEVEVGD